MTVKKMKKQFDIIIPFGSRCISSMKLRANNLQYESFPFDWLYHANLDIVTKLITSNFSRFLEKENMQPTHNKDAIAEHLDTSNGISFIHDFENHDLDACFPKVKERYNRRIARMYQHINKAKNIMLIHSNYDDVSDEKLLEAFNKISSQYPQKNITLVYAQINTYAGVNVKHQINDKLIKFSLYDADNDFNEAYRYLFSNYNLSLVTKLKTYFPNLLYKLKKVVKSRAVIKFICCFIPFKKQRQKMRLIFRMGAQYKD